MPQAPALIPSKPPIRDEDGLVEVGWEGDLEDENSEPGKCVEGFRLVRGRSIAAHEELIEDRYAALQAQSELTRNEGWLTSASAAHPGQVPDELPETADALEERARYRPNPLPACRRAASGPRASTSSRPTASSSRGTANRTSRDRSLGFRIGADALHGKRTEKT